MQKGGVRKRNQAYIWYRLSYSGISQDEMIEASKKGFLCD